MRMSDWSSDVCSSDLFHGRELGPCPFTRLFGEILWRTDTRHDVLTLRIDQEFAIIAILSGRGIAGEGNARGGRITHVSEYHRLHIDRRAPIPGNTVKPAVDFGPLSMPGTKNGPDGTPKLQRKK